ncbi:MAG: hypothetical protein ABSG78_16550 [Verrucomicrobiota bacterium]|jgi:hypothetical protein
MSLPAFSTQSELFSTAGLSGSLFADTINRKAATEPLHRLALPLHFVTPSRIV